MWRWRRRRRSASCSRAGSSGCYGGSCTALCAACFNCLAVRSLKTHKPNLMGQLGASVPQLHPIRTH